MIGKIVKLSFAAFLLMALVGARNSVDAKYGKGAAHAAVVDGVQSASETFNVGAQIPAVLVESVKPGAQRLGQQFGGVLGSVTGGTTDTTVPSQWNNQTAPAEQGAGG